MVPHRHRNTKGVHKDVQEAGLQNRRHQDGGRPQRVLRRNRQGVRQRQNNVERSRNALQPGGGRHRRELNGGSYHEKQGHLTNRVDLIDLPNYEQKFTNVEGVIG